MPEADVEENLCLKPNLKPKIKSRFFVKRFFLFIVNIVLCVLLYSCLSEEDYTLDASARLTFSTDTLSFDTVIAGEPTGTHTFQVFNHHSKGIRIRRIYLEKGKSSFFRLNIDGVSLKEGETTDLEILGGDSLRIFAELTAPVTDSNLPSALEETLFFQLESGVLQKMMLKGSGQRVTIMRSVVLKKDTVLSSERPYQIFDSLVVDEGVTLTLSSGCRLWFHPTASLIVRGRLLAEGTLQAPIEMRGDRLGNMFSNQPYDRIPNQWGGVVFASTSTENKLNYCDIHSGAFGIRCDSADATPLKLLLENSIIHNVEAEAFSSKLCNTIVGNTQITNAGGDCVRLIGGKHSFTHCTIGRFYVFQGQGGVAVRFSNHDGGKRFPLWQADFSNCLITGYSSDDIMGEPSARYKDEPFNYKFNHCLLNTPKTEDKNLIKCLFEEELPDDQGKAKHFSPGFDLKKLLFSFLLSPHSSAVNKADPAVSRTLYPHDRLGNNRFLDGTPDIGCYEALPLSTEK